MRRLFPVLRETTCRGRRSTDFISYTVAAMRPTPRSIGSVFDTGVTRRRFLKLTSLCGVMAGLPVRLQAAERWTIGLTASDAGIEALVAAGSATSAPAVLLIGGLQGRDDTSEIVAREFNAYDAIAQERRRFRLLALPVANPEGRSLQFPPSGVAYRDNPESHVLWRWIGIQAPDLVLVAGESAAGLAEALTQTAVGFVGRIPAQVVTARAGIVDSLPSTIASSEARLEIERRRSRSPRVVADELAAIYGHDFNQPTYISGDGADRAVAAGPHRRRAASGGTLSERIARQLCDAVAEFPCRAPPLP